MTTLGGILGQLRGQFAEMTDAISGSRALGMLDEQIRATDEQLREWRRMRDVLKAHRFNAQESLEATLARIHQRELQAVAALQAGEIGLAREVAGAIVELEQPRDATLAQIELGDQRMAELQHLIERGENTLRRLKHRLDLTHAAETVARAEDSLARSAGEGVHIPTAIESAELLRQRSTRQGRPGAPSEADDSEEDPLDAKLEAAGLGGTVSRVDAVLERLRLQARAEAKPARRKSPARSKGKP